MIFFKMQSGESREKLTETLDYSRVSFYNELVFEHQNRL